MKRSFNIPEAKIRSVIWMLKVGKSKKECCIHLNIPYNTKRLTKIIEDFKVKNERNKQLRKIAAKNPLSESTIKNIVSSYVDNESIAKIADRYYISSQRVKKVLINKKIPIRGKSKNIPATIDHVKEDYNIPFILEEKCFIPGNNNIKISNKFGIIKQIFDEKYLSYLANGYRKAIYNPHVKISDNKEPIENIHYYIYWILQDGTLWGMANALQNHYTSIENILIETGREFYKVWVNEIGYCTIKREDMLKITK